MYAIIYCPKGSENLKELVCVGVNAMAVRNNFQARMIAGHVDPEGEYLLLKSEAVLTPVFKVGDDLPSPAPKYQQEINDLICFIENQIESPEEIQNEAQLAIMLKQVKAKLEGIQ